MIISGYLALMFIYIIIVIYNLKPVKHKLTILDIAIQIGLIILAPIGILMFIWYVITEKINWEYKPFNNIEDDNDDCGC
jgi:hypothetical protein